MNEPVSIIILNYNGRQFLKNCFDSVLNQSYKDFEIIFFDNNSTDGSAEFVKNNYKNEKITIAESGKNLGFAEGNNKAINHAKNDLVVLLNNDTVCEKDWLKFLVEAVKEKNTVASSFVITKGVNQKYYESNGSVSYGMYNIMNIFNNIEDEFYPNGCSLIFRKSQIGLPFDSDYFYYSEDLYLGLKARFLGMNVKFVKDSVVHHFGGGASSANMMRTFYQERNRWLNLYSFFSPWFIIRLLPVISLLKTAKLFQALFSNKYSFTGVLKAYLWFYFHIPTIIKKRKALRQFKKVSEKDVIKFMTSKLLNEESTLSKIINRLSCFYSRSLGIKTVEYCKSAESKLS